MSFLSLSVITHFRAIIVKEVSPRKVIRSSVLYYFIYPLPSGQVMVEMVEALSFPTSRSRQAKVG